MTGWLPYYQTPKPAPPPAPTHRLVWVDYERARYLAVVPTADLRSDGTITTGGKWERFNP
jgi:hypothetical protein